MLLNIFSCIINNEIKTIMTKFKGIKTTWRKVENIVRAEYIGTSHKICEVNIEMSYPATKEQGEANMKLILAAPKMFEALVLIAEKLKSEELGRGVWESKEYKLWEIANDAIKYVLVNN